MSAFFVLNCLERAVVALLRGNLDAAEVWLRPVTDESRRGGAEGERGVPAAP